MQRRTKAYRSHNWVRDALYERNYAGNQEQIRLDTLMWADKRGDTARYRSLVEPCLGDYDLDGWTVDYLRQG